MKTLTRVKEDLRDAFESQESLNSTSRQRTSYRDVNADHCLTSRRLTAHRGTISSVLFSAYLILVMLEESLQRCLCS